MTNDSKGSRSPGPLVETDWLAAQLGAPDLRVFDCTTHLIPNPVTVYDVESGRAGYDEGHIPGAGFLDLHGELSDLESDLRFTLPSADQFAAVMSGHGVGDGTRVVLYSQTTVQWATRIWWMLKTFGFDDAMVLNGGLTKWRQEGRPLATEPANYPSARFAAKPRPELIADKASVLAALDDPDSLVLNSLSHEQHAGGGRNYGRPGRIANSVCVPAAELLDGDSGAYLPLDELRTKFEAVGALDAPRVVAYCGGGIAASSDSFILSLFGHEGVSLYDGSLSEWVRDPALPMEID
ncbi:MAG: sulfurtransferase [Alphaproteobacteria bacterium]|jgi:thiosulfate/3-mercaptopyruvate sulfurtransferase|nr:sulfurtransferase [Alphaproteobacteria bacterium]